MAYDILADPDEVANNAVISFETALWFWTTPSPPKPSCHDVMVGNWSPSSEDIADGREPGFPKLSTSSMAGLSAASPVPQLTTASPITRTPARSWV